MLAPRRMLLACLVLILLIPLQAQASTESLVKLENGELVYGTYANQGQMNSVNTIPDFSYAGYRGMEAAAIPDWPATVTLSPEAGDNRQRIQDAIDYVSGLTPNMDGHRGVVELDAGTFEVNGTLYITASGVVLRGAGQGTDGTIVRATANYQHDLIKVIGNLPATTAVEAESFDGQSGVTVASGGTGTVVRDIKNGSWVKYDNFDFNLIELFEVSMSGVSDDSVLRLRVDSPTGTVIGACPTPNTGGMDTYRTFTCPITPLQGARDLYMTFERADSLDIGKFDYFAYQRLSRQQAELFDDQSGVAATSGGTGTVVSGIASGDWVKYEDFDFNGVQSFLFNMSGEHADSVMKVRIDSPSGTVIGECGVRVTGDENVFANFTCYVSMVEGVKDLYLTFERPDGLSVGQLDFFAYTRIWDEEPGTRVPVVSDYVPTGSRTVTVADASAYSVGDKIVILRVPNDTWISDLQSPYTVYDYKMGYENRIAAIDGDELTVEIPFVQALDPYYDSSYVFKAEVPRISEVGIEYLRLESDHIDDLDENHGWRAVRLTYVENSWMRNVTAKYFGFAAVQLYSARSVTVQDSAMLEPKSKIEGERRYSFSISGESSLNLIQRNYASEGRHDYVTGIRVPGPNVFLDSLTEYPYNENGPHQRYATGLLFDNIKGGDLRIRNRSLIFSNSLHGWQAAQAVLWNNDSNGEIWVDSPPGGMNFVLGSKGAVQTGNGRFEDWGTHVVPRSLYLQQLQDRLGPAAVDRVATAAQKNGTIWRYLSAWSGEPLLADENMEQMTLGQAPVGWTLDEAGGSVTVETAAGNPGKSIELHDTSGTNVVSATKSFTASNAVVIAEYKVMFGAGDYYYTGLYGGATEAIRLRAANGIIDMQSGGSYTPLQSYTPDTWYTIKIVADPAVDKADIYIDGVLRQSQGAFRAAVSVLDKVFFRTHTTGTNMTMYADDLIVSSPPLRMNEHFDDMAAGQPPERWIVDQTGGTVTVETASGVKSLTLADTSSTDGVSAARRFHPYADRLTYEFKIKYGSNADYNFIKLQGGVVGEDVNGRIKNAVVLRTFGGKLQVQNGSSYADLQSFTPGVWYTLKVVADPNTDTADIYIDGTLKQSQGAFSIPVNYLSRVFFHTYSTGTGITVNIDDLRIGH